MMMELSAKNTHNTFMDCLFREDEDKTNYVKADAIMVTVGFHPGRLEGHKEDIRSMLNGLPEVFKEGMTFLNMCQDKNDRQWADFHQTMDELVALGLAAGFLTFPLPREFWSSLPGGVPYILVNTKP